MTKKGTDNSLVESLTGDASTVLELTTFSQKTELLDSDQQNTDRFIKIERRKGCFQRLTECFKSRKSEEDRTIRLGAPNTYQKHIKNVVRNQKYSILTLIPLVLYNEFKYFFNLFYLLIALSQFYQPLKVGFLFTYVFPLAFVLAMTLIKEAYDDIKRWIRDKEINSSKYMVLRPGGLKVQKKSSELKAGDIIEVNPTQRIPADLILLYSSEENGTTFIRTDQLDGETDWKLRRAIRYTQEFFAFGSYDIARLDCIINFKSPTPNIYHFEGAFESNLRTSSSEPLFLDHTLWTDTKITSGRAFGAVIYTGAESRPQMNSRKPQPKTGKLELELNFITKILFVLMFIIATCIEFLHKFNALWYIQLFRYMLLMSSIIPISLRINLDFAKMVFTGKINNDNTIPGTIARNSNVPEELGRISYLLSDKTGTLTKNEMYFKKLILESTQYEVEDIGQIAKIIKTQCEKYHGPLSNYQSRSKDVISNFVGMMSMDSARKANTRRDKDLVLRDFATAISVCHNVTPITENGERILHASSPDEIALVKFAQDIKMNLFQRTAERIILENPIGQIESYRILAIFPFSSETKKMGILVRHELTNRIIYFLKGADVAISPKVREVYRALLLDECEALARTGLRTMVFAQKLIDEEEYEKWKLIWDDANLSLTNRDAKMKEAASLLEVNLDFIGITGVEDLLQDEINLTIESLRNAGIKIWMLTGDKVETAKCIAISTGLKRPNDDIFEIKDTTDDLNLTNMLNEFSNKYNKVLLIDGVSMTKVLESHSSIFFEAAVRAPAVICSRCLPNQKAIIAEKVKKYSQQRVACIGDGGNDVGMIQAADVGLGIVGKEGKQASLASDFSVTQFKFIKSLILWHGRLYYKNSAKMSQFVIHRGLIVSFIQALFMCFFYFVAIPIYNGMLMVGYTSLYTMFPVLSLVYDEDISREQAFNYPILYKSLQKSRELNAKTFLIWVWKSLFQATTIMVMAVYIFPDTFLNIVTITFTALVLSEILNVYTELTKIGRLTIFCLVGTAVVYFWSIIFFKTLVDVETITITFMLKIIVIVSVSWLPLHAIKLLMRRISPTDYEKIMNIN